MKIIRSYQQKPLARMVHEGVLIRESVVDILLNSKEEFVQPGEVVQSYGPIPAGEAINGARYVRREVWEGSRT